MFKFLNPHVQYVNTVLSHNKLRETYFYILKTRQKYVR